MRTGRQQASDDGGPETGGRAARRRLSAKQLGDLQRRRAREDADELARRYEDWRVDDREPLPRCD